MVVIFLAQGFEETEALAPADLLRRAGIEVKLVGIGGMEITGSHGITVRADLTDEELDFSDLEMMVLPGGLPGATNLEESRTVQSFLTFCQENDRWIAAICAAPYILGRRGLLQGRRATCYPGYEKEFAGGTYTGAPVERDGKIITARGAGVALEFGLALVAALQDQEAADRIKVSIQFRD